MHIRKQIRDTLALPDFVHKWQRHLPPEAQLDAFLHYRPLHHFPLSLSGHTLTLPTAASITIAV